MLADNVSGDVETSLYASEYVCLLVEVFLMAGCVYMIMPRMPVLDMP